MAVIKSADHSEMVDVVLFEQAASGETPIQNTASEYRMLLDALVTNPGVVGDGLKATENSGAPHATQVTLSAGYIVLPEKAPLGGKYLARLTAPMTVDVPAAPPSGTAKKHQIIAYALDKADSGDSDYGWAIEVLVDNGSGTSLPSYATSLGYVNRVVGTSVVTNAAIEDSRARAVGGTWRYIASAAAVNSVTVAVPAGIRSIKVNWRARTNLGSPENPGSNGYDQIHMRFNNDSGSSHYENEIIAAGGTGNVTTMTEGVSAYKNLFGTTTLHIGYSPGIYPPADVMGIGSLEIMGWNHFYPGFTGHSYTFGGTGLAGQDSVHSIHGGRYLVAATPSSIRFYAQGGGLLTAGSEFVLEGTY